MDFANASCRNLSLSSPPNAPVPGGGGRFRPGGCHRHCPGQYGGLPHRGQEEVRRRGGGDHRPQAEVRQPQKELLDQIAADAKGFEPLAKAYGIPKDDPNRTRSWRKPPSWPARYR